MTYIIFERPKWDLGSSYEEYLQARYTSGVIKITFTDGSLQNETSIQIKIAIQKWRNLDINIK
jgi:hypothetical protein